MDNNLSRVLTVMSQLIRLVGTLLPLMLLATIFIAITFPNSAIAAEMRLNVQSNYRSITIEGRIERGDYDRFIKLVATNQGLVSGVILLSPGGDFVEAIKLGRALKALELSSRVPMKSRNGGPACEDASMGEVPRDPANCTAASAAFFIHIGAAHRGGTYLAVHRPTFDPKAFGQLSESEARTEFEQLQALARAYMKEMSVPDFIIEEVLNTPSDKVSVLEERVVKTHFWGDSPYRQEWRKARCTKLSGDELSELKSLSSQLLSARTLPNDRLARLTELNSLQDSDMRCQLDLLRESRLTAFKNFFGKAASDTDGHQFGRWADASNYLDRTFEDLASEQRFEIRDGFGGHTSMDKRATATSPHISVMDGRMRKKYVTWVNVFQPNPSEQFLAQLVATLKLAWGVPVDGDQGTGLTWSTPKLVARLKVEPTSNVGRYVSLIIERP